MDTRHTLDAYCADCADVTPHEARSRDVETCRCLVCDREQTLVVA